MPKSVQRPTTAIVEQSVPAGEPWARVIEKGQSLRIIDVEPRVEMDALAVISNCPQVNNPCNAGQPSAIRVMVLVPG